MGLFRKKTEGPHSPNVTQKFQTHHSQQTDEAEMYTKSEAAEAKSWRVLH